MRGMRRRGRARKRTKTDSTQTELNRKPASSDGRRHRGAGGYFPWPRKTWPDSVRTRFFPHAFSPASSTWDDPIHVINASGPGAAAGPLQCRPEPGVVGQAVVWPQIGPAWDCAASTRAACSAPNWWLQSPTRSTLPSSRSRSIVMPFDPLRAPCRWVSGERLGSDMSDARTGAYA